MSVVLSDKNYTIEDYMNLNDDRRYELIEGELILVPSPTRKHQSIVIKLVYQFENFLKYNFSGEIYANLDVHLENKVVCPDLLFISKERLDIAGDLYIQGAPDLVVEILSPSTASYDRKKKSRLYFSCGVKEYWLVDPLQHNVEVFLAGEKEWRWAGVFDQEDVLTTSLLPGLEVILGDVFECTNKI